MLYLSVRQCDETPLNTLDRFHLSIAFHTVSCLRSSWWTGINTVIFKLPTLLVRWMSWFIAYGLGILTYASVKGHHVFKHPFILNKNVLTQWGKKWKSYIAWYITFRLQEVFITNCLINAILNWIKLGSTQHKTEACQLIGGAFVDLASKICE